MKKLELKEMENINGGTWFDVATGLTCLAAGFWPIGTLIAGPSCVGLLLAHS